jgi:hypothetical protein
MLGRMDNEIRKQQTLKGYALVSSDYESGLKVLARIIARVHMKRMSNKGINGDNQRHNRKQVVIVQKGPIKIKSDGELVNEKPD